MHYLFAITFCLISILLIVIVIDDFKTLIINVTSRFVRCKISRQVKKRLEKMKIEVSNVTAEQQQACMCCMICLEEFSAGSEATRTPCRHVYHHQCIAEWLEKSDSCPLCRCNLLDFNVEYLNAFSV
ncbi:hypothetical protein LWI29_020675 [Acer saccharum]|uniref:RING-type domain-containing protein n=1 Tax=Acer saccharum TaxID=4024 RepID=A0AA39SD16_ACESA|nr:hypothetical protein LWI29_020675 [Acer saccharum]